MRHCVEDYVDAHRIGFRFGEVSKVILVLALTLPTVPEVGVVADDDHHPFLVVKDALIMDFAAIVGPGSPLKIPPVHGKVDAGQLGFFLEVENRVKDGVLKRQFLGFPIGKDPFHLKGEVVVLIPSPEVIHKQETPIEEVFPKSLHLIFGKPQIAWLDDVDKRVIEQLRIGQLDHLALRMYLQGSHFQWLQPKLYL